MSVSNLYFQNSKVSRKDRQMINGHKGCLIWLTGLSGSGKSTIAFELEKVLFDRKIQTFVLDGDNVRYGLNKDLDFSPSSRTENIRRIAEVSKLFVTAGVVVIASIISPEITQRQMVRLMFDEYDFVEVFVNCCLEECERRDPKGLYMLARSGKIKDFTGVSASYEAPLNPEIIIETDKQKVSDSVEKILNFIEHRGYL